MPRVQFIAGLFLASTLVPSAFPAPETLTGHLIDITCYAQDRANTGIAHRGKGVICAQACAREGFSVGILMPNGRVYRIIGDLSAHQNAQLVPLMSQVVTITGEVAEKDGQFTIAASDLKPEK